MENKQLTLPVSVISPTDVARLTREVENLDEFFRQSEIRQGGQPQSLPRYSRLLDEVVVANKLNLLDKTERSLLVQSFNQLQERAPVMHISFSVDPPGSYVQKIVGWLRQNIDGLVLVRVGLMPNIGAGCVVRTTNKSFDFSLRKYFDSKHEYFMKRLHKVLVPEEEVTEQVVETKKPEIVNQQIGSQNNTADVNKVEQEQQPNTIPQTSVSETGNNKTRVESEAQQPDVKPLPSQSDSVIHVKVNQNSDTATEVKS